MNSKSLSAICDLEALPFPFIVRDKNVLLMDVNESQEEVGEVIPTADGGTTRLVINSAMIDHNSKKTIRAKVVGLPNNERDQFAHGFALGDIVMVHPGVGNKIMLEGKEFQVARAEDVVGWYALSKNAPLLPAEIPFRDSTLKSPKGMFAATVQ